MDMRPGVLVTVCNQGWLHRKVVFVLMQLLQEQRYKVRIVLPVHRPYENALQHCVNDLLAGSEQWWLNFDADNPPQKNPLDLIKRDLDVVGCPTPVWHHAGPKDDRPFYWNVYKKSDDIGYKEWPIKEGLQKVDAVGTGCVVYARRVFEHPDLQVAAFQRVLGEDGTVLYGNDISFCQRATEAGFQIWAHYDYPCNHHVEIPLNEMIEAFAELGAKNGTH